MSERIRNAVVISPHHDDAAISLSSTISNQYERARLVNIFTRSDSTILDIEAKVGVITQIRTEEDASFVARYGYSSVNGGFPDSELRGVAWNDQEAEIDQELLGLVSAWIKEQTENVDEPFDLFIPAAFGLHPDHYMAMIAAIKTNTGKPVHVYAEQPYFADNSGCHKGHKMLTNEKRISCPTQDKREALSFYPSQFSNERIKWLSQIELEHYWQLTVEEQEIFLRLSYLRNDQGEIRTFGSSDWVDKIKQSYTSSQRTFLDISIPTRSNEQASLPVCIDTFDIPGIGEVKVARHASIYTSDYLVIGEGTGFDQSSYQAFRSAVSNSGADIILLSNVRVESDFYSCLGEQTKTSETAILLKNISSVGLICEPSYEDWYALQTKNMRRNIRRKLEKLNATAEEMGDSLRFELKRLDEFSLENLLQNQKRRAATTGLNAYIDDSEFSQFLSRLVDIPSIQIAELRIGNEVVSSLLLIVEPERKTIGIYLQSFSEKWTDYSPSFCSITKLIEHAHKNGFLYVDFLRGEEDYKLGFVNNNVNMVKFLDQLNPKIDRGILVNFIKNYEE